MKRLHTTLLVLAALATALAATSSACAADFARIRATLILGANDGTGVDQSLQVYEKHLKRFFPFDSFKQQRNGRTELTLPGSRTIALGGGHSVAVRATDAGNGKLRIATTWVKEGRTLINTTVVSAPNQPTVLAGPSEKNGKLILLLVANE